MLRSPKNLLLLAHTCAKLNRTDEAKEWHRKCLEAKVVTPEDQQTVAEAKKLKKQEKDLEEFKRAEEKRLKRELEQKKRDVEREFLWNTRVPSWCIFPDRFA